MGVGYAIGVLIERVLEVLRDADVGEAVHGEGVLACLRVRIEEASAVFAAVSKPRG